MPTRRTKKKATAETLQIVYQITIKEYHVMVFAGRAIPSNASGNTGGPEQVMVKLIGKPQKKTPKDCVFELHFYPDGSKLREVKRTVYNPDKVVVIMELNLSQLQATLDMLDDSDICQASYGANTTDANDPAKDSDRYGAVGFITSM